MLDTSAILGFQVQYLQIDDHQHHSTATKHQTLIVFFILMSRISESAWVLRIVSVLNELRCSRKQGVIYLG